MAHFSIISSQGGDTIFEGAPRYVGAYLKPGYLEFPAIGSPNPISWHVGDYVVYSRTGKTYRLYRTPQSIEQGESNRYGASFLYENVQFFDDSKQLEFCPFTDLVPGDNTVHFSTQNTVSFFGKPLNVAERLQACLEAQYGAGSWIIRIVTTTDADLLELLDTEVEFAVTGANCLEVLDQVYETWNGLGWIHTVENGVNVITIGASNVRTNANTTVPFSYGDGLVRVERSIANADQIGTRLFAYGSMKNMDATYYRGLDIYNAESVDIEHLMIPLANWGHTDNKPDARKAYIENAAAIAQLGLIPRTAYFDGTGDLPDIHPTIERMTIGEVYDAGGAGYLPNLSKWTRSQRVDEIVSAVNPDDNGTSADRGQKYVEGISGTLGSVSESFVDHDFFNATIFSGTLLHGGRLTLKFGRNRQTFTLGYAWNPLFNLNLSVSAGAKTQTFPLEVVRVSGTSFYFLLPETITISNTTAGALTVSVTGYIGQDEDATTPGGTGTFDTDVTTTVGGGLEYELSKTFEVTIPQIGFDIDDYAALGNGKTLSMKTGMCAGRDFEIKDATYVSSTDSWKLTLYRSVDEDLNIMFPNSDYEIAAGDQYVLLDIAMPEMYVTVASQRLLAAAQTLLADISVEQPFYAPQIDAKVVYNEGRVLLEGMWMHVRAAEGGDTMLESSDPADLQEFTGLFLASADTSRTNAYVLIDSITIDENGSNIPTYEVALRQRKGVEWTENVGRSTSSKSSVSVGSQDAQQQSGSVTSVGLSAPTGFVVEGSPVTGAGVLGLKLASGYKIPLESELASFFEVGALQTLIQLKSAYDYLGARDGLFFTGGDTSTPLPDLYVDVIQDAGGNNVRVLRSPLPLITGGDQIVTSGTPGQGGGGGGGAEFLYQLSDVYGSTSVLRPDGTDRVAGDALVFVGGSLNKWAAKTLVASVAGLSGDVTVAQLATALSDAGYKLTDTIYTLPVATSGALGGIKIGYTQSGKNYPVQLSSQKAYVNVPWTDVSFGTAGTDNVPITLGSTTKNVLTAHQTVTLASGTNNGTLKLTTAAGTVDNIAVKGLGSMAYKATSDYLAYSTERASSTNAIDLNDYTSSDNGEMKLVSWDNAGSQYAAHRPVTSSRAASLYVLPNRWGGMQLYVDYNSSVYYLRNKYNDWTSWVEMYHSGNANKSDVAWTCSSLTANGAVSAKYGSQVVLTLSRSDNNYTAIEFLGKVDGTADVALGRIGYNTSGAWVRDASDTAYRLIYHQGNLTKAVVTGLIGDETYHPYGGGNIAFQASTLTATGTLTVANDDAAAAGEIRGGQIVLTRGASTTANNSAGAITFYGRRLSGSYRNGARIASVKGGSWDLQDLVFYTSNNQDTAAPTFEEAMRIAYNKAVSINASLSIGTTLGVDGLSTLTGGATIPGTTTAYLQIGQAKITWNSNGYLHIDKPLVTAGDQIVISGTPGGGGGGGATTLNGLDDVSVSSLANNNVLVWDSTLRSGQGAWKNVAASSIGGVTSVVGQTGAVTAEQIASALTSAGYQLTDTTYSQGTGISISGTTISLASTYAGGTAVTLNGVNKAANTASFYAPTAGGAANKVLIGKGTTTAPDWSGFTLTGTANTAYNLADFLTGNQNITLSGDVTGSGTTSITTTIGTGKITNAMLAGSIENSKLNTIGAAKGGTGLTTWTGAYRLIYSTAATTVTTLAPNTSATRKFLRMTGTGSAGAAPAWDTVTKTDVGLSNVENTALSSWAGTSSITTLGTITTGVWNGTAIANSYLANSAITINGTSTSLGGSFNTASITAGTAGQSTASSGLSFSVPYVTISAYGIVTAYGTHTHTISAANITTAIGSTTYAPYHADGYLPLSGGTLTGPLTKSSQVILSLSRTDSYFTAIEFLGKVDGTVDTALGRIGYSTTGAWVRDASDTAYRYIWHSGNSNLSTVDWSVKDLTAAGNIYLPNLGNLYGKNSSGTDLRMMYVSSSNNLIIGIDFATAGTTYIYGNTVSFRAGGTSSIVNIESTGIKPYTTDTTTLGTSSLRWSNIYGNDMELIKSGGNASIILRGTSNANVAGGSIYFYSRSNKYNGFRIGTLGATYDRQSLVFYISGTGAGEYISDTWTQAMRIHYNGKVKIGTGTPSQALDVTGSILSTGDQVVSSDLTKKTNLVPIDLKVEQIAAAPAVTFDWKTGGHSFGSVAQYWKDVLGEAVLGTEGNYALAYGQLALVNTIIEAREIDKLKARVAALEAEVKRLTAN